MLLDPELLKKTGVFALASSELSALVIAGYFLGCWLGGFIGHSQGVGSAMAMIGFGIGVWRVYYYLTREK